MHEALYYSKLGNNKIRCELCPWFCELQPAQTGICKVRSNENGTLVTHVFNKVAAIGVDPIEKKPLYHFHPGKNILSIGEVGCNLHCTFCQNHRISQCLANGFKGFQNTTSQKIVDEALKTHKNIGIAYTYNEPFTFYEFMLETARQAHAHKLKNVVVSNGYINIGPLKQILPFIDAFNIDLKAFSNGFYQSQTKGKLQPVLESLKIIAKSKAHLEITNLVIPGLNDGETAFKTMIDWIANELGNETPLHLSRFFPQHELQLSPTPMEKLNELHDIAKLKLQYVYLGNVSDNARSATYCPNCNATLVTRHRFQSFVSTFLESGKCKNCGTTININL